MILRHFILPLLLASMTLGFRAIPDGNSWSINNSSAAERKLFVIHNSGSSTLSNNLPAGDTLAGSGDLTVDQIVASVISDYNAVSGSFVTLVEDTDGDFAALGGNRSITIEIKDGATGGGLTTGVATQGFSGSTVTSCKIEMSTDLLSNAKSFTSVLAHEMGHCLGLDHPQDTTNALMSYFVDLEVTRLQLDDKIGLVALYPADSGGSSESQSLGLSCAPK